VTRLLELSGHATLPWTAGEPLPGGNIPDGDFEKFVDAQVRRYSWLPLDVVRRYAFSYGTSMDRFLDGASKPEDLGRHFGDNVYEAEIVYLVKMEWARTIEDVLWRRSKLGMHIQEDTLKNIERALPSIVRKGNGRDAEKSGRTAGR